MSDANETPAPPAVRRSRADRWVKRGFILAILATLAVVAYVQLRGPKLGWPSDLSAALAKAKAENRKVLVFVGKFPSNPKIQDMVGNTIPKNKAALKKGGFLLVEINLDPAADWAKKYGVTQAPTTLVIAPDGESFHREAGVIGEEPFKAFLAAPLRRGGPAPEERH